MARGTLLAGIACLVAGWSLVSAPPAALAQGQEDRGGAVAGAGAGAGPARRARASPADTWLKLISGEHPHQTAAGGPGADDDADHWFPRPVPVSLPIGRSNDGKTVSLPVLLLPIPVGGGGGGGFGGGASHKTTSQCDIPAPQTKPQSSYDEQSSYERTAPKPQSSFDSSLKEYIGQQPQPFAQHPPLPASPAPSLAPSALPALMSTQYSQYGDEPVVPHLDYVVSSRQLVELFQAQEAPSPELPPAVIPDPGGACAEPRGEGGEPVGPPLSAPYRGSRFARAATRARRRPVRMRRYEVGAPPPPPPPPHSALHAPPAGPAPLRLDRSLVLRGELTVPRAGYTEPYTVWWDAVSGAARVDLHCGATSIYRTVMPDGRMRETELRADRAGAGEVRRCRRTAARAPAAADRALPGLPDLQPFVFTGYVESEYGRVERWAHSVGGGAGELGGARGEALTFRHELLAVRAADNVTATPLKYSVSVDSSVLGVASDGYVHRYTALRDQRHEPGLFVLDLVESCDEVRPTAARELVDPLREFTISHRDLRYDAVFSQFKQRHARRYADDTEEAVRKNLLVQHSRFVASNNRQGATFATEVNHLGDRLDAELAVLSGVREEGGPGSGEPFPHSRDQLAAARSALPRQFDWRKKGAVTHVRNQGSCSSCWAFAVAGAVEGALYLATRSLVPLSEQCLVDCAHPSGGHGCGGTWPRAAYDYTRARGLPALHGYAPYQGKVLQCSHEPSSSVTRVRAHVNVTSNNVDALKVAIRRHAPTVVIIDDTTKTFLFYKKGVINDERCAKNKALHAVLAVGWGVRGGGEGEHIIVKNSWSAAWGDGGYARLAARPNTCGVLTRPSYPHLERADVNFDRLPATETPPS